MANLLGLSLRSVNRYEVGALEPKRQTVLAWALATGVDPEWLTGAKETGSVYVINGYGTCEAA